MMKLTFDNNALNKINQLKNTQDELVLDLDDGIGEFSDYLSQNGLKYNLFITPAKTIPVTFSNVLMSNAGKVYFNHDTELTLDQDMQVIFDYHTSTFQLRSTNTLLEPNFQISKKSPTNDIAIR
ncbi:iron-sulfur cluster biosynthesis family protein [Lactiplantibacillus nangangensis]|uniref:Iron-sulfur cluster biosynthesis family protein n=1 Tax=Lactiplantibacillus nangangensis TaxID=2559917 RepID=A0ABW1SM76_9LACO|nr:iron-sulfur cluster biosynthesis family protein [Lactiplantibacillus nangangensis]